MTRSPTWLARYVCPIPMMLVSKGRFGQGWPAQLLFAPNSALSNTAMISRGFTTPRPAVMTMARPTTATFFLYGEKVRTTRRTVAGLIGRGSSSSGRAPMPNMRPCRPIAFNDTAEPRMLRGRASTDVGGRHSAEPPMCARARL